MRAYAFEWKLYCSERLGAAVVLAGNVRGARKLLCRGMARRWGSTEMVEQMNASTPGPYWTAKAKEAVISRVVYFNSPCANCMRSECRGCRGSRLGLQR